MKETSTTLDVNGVNPYLLGRLTGPGQLEANLTAVSERQKAKGHSVV
jgi:hypothetical protein